MDNSVDHESPYALIVPLRLIARVAVTLAFVTVAVIGGRWVWIHYNVEPWTRDARIRADIVQVSPDVSGLVTEVSVKNDQPVSIGQILFVLDRPRFELAERQAEAGVAAQQAALDEAIREDRRNRALGNLTTAEQVEQGSSTVAELRAQLSSAIVQRDVARLNLERTTVRATVNGIATNVELQVGNYAPAGHQVMAVVNSDSIWVEGYFEETKLPAIRVGDSASVQIMGLKRKVFGVVESITAGIEDRERGASSRDLANINPTFSWVRLAQRIPVRIHLNRVPAEIRLISGRTATVAIHVPEGRRLEGE
jgi:multidrug resistance efflux pump